MILFLLFSILFYAGLPLQAARVTWQGDVTAQWDLADNWDTGSVPAAGDSVIIPSVAVLPSIINDVGEIEYLNLDEHSSLFIFNGGKLRVNGENCVGCRGVFMERYAELFVDVGASLEVRNVGEYGIYNQRGVILNDGTISIDQTGSTGIYNWNNQNDSPIVEFINNGDIDIANTGGSAFYNHIERDTMYFTNAGNIFISNAVNSGLYLYSYRENSLITFENTGFIKIDTVGDYGFINYVRRNDVNFRSSLYFDNYGTIDIDSTENIGFYNYARNDHLYFVNHPGATILVSRTDNRGMFNYNDQTNLAMNPHLEFDNYGTIEIDHTRTEGFYSYNEMDTVNVVNHTGALIKVSHIRGTGFRHLSDRRGSVTTFINDGVIDIDTIRATAMYNQSDYDDDGDFARMIFINNGSIQIDSVENTGLYNRTNNGVTVFTNNGNLDINVTGGYGMYNEMTVPNSGNWTSQLDFENNMPMSISHTASYGIYNYTNGQTLNFTNNSDISMNVLGNRGLYCYANNNNALLNFINDGTMDMADVNHRGIELRSRRSDPSFTSEMYFTNNGMIDVANTVDDGAYIYSEIGELFFTNNGTLNFSNAMQDALYIYAYRKNLSFINTQTGVIDIDSAGLKGVFVYANEREALLDFENHGLIDVQTTLGEEGVITYSRKNRVADAPHVNFDNYGTIHIDDTAEEGFQNYNYNSTLDFVNHSGALIDISHSAEYGMYNYNQEVGADSIYNTLMTCTNNGTIFIDSTAWEGFYNNNENASRLDIVNNGLLDIFEVSGDGIFNYNRQTEVNYAPTQLNFDNYGEIQIDSTSESGIYNYAYHCTDLNFTNHSIIDIVRTNERGMYNRSRNTNDAFPKVTLNVDNHDGTMTISETNWDGIYNYVERNATLNFTGDNGVLHIFNTNEEGMDTYCYRENSVVNIDYGGAMTFDNIPSYSLYNHTYITGVSQIADFNFTNNGTMTFVNTGAEGIYNYNSRGTNLTFTNAGVIVGDGLDFPLIYNYNYTNNSGYTDVTLTFDNTGDINSSDARQKPILNYNYANTLIFNNSGNINLLNSEREGIHNINYDAGNAYSSDFDFNNTGFIHIQDPTYEAFKTTNYGGKFDMVNDGTIDIRGGEREGLETVSYSDTVTVTNNGWIDIRDTNWESIYNSAFSFSPVTFINNQCGYIQIDSKFKNNDDCTVINHGVLVSYYSGVNTNKFVMINNGVVESPNNFLASPNPLQNNAIVQGVLTMPRGSCMGGEIANALNNDNAIYTIYDVYADKALTTLAGTYHSGSNLFSPDYNVLGLGTHTLWLDVSDNLLGCDWLREMEITIAEPPMVMGVTAATACEGESIPPLTVTGESDPIVYRWYDSLTNGPILYTGTSFIASPPAANGTFTYYVEAYNTDAECVSDTRTPVVLTIDAAPAAPTAVNHPVVACSSGTLPALSVESGGANIEYTWHNNPLTSLVLHTGTDFVPNITPLPGDYTYYVEATDLTTGCKSVDRAAITLTLNESPREATPLMQFVHICIDENIPALNVVDDGPPTEYRWYDQATGGTVLHIGTTYSPSPALPFGVFTYFVESVNTTNSCTSGDRTPITLTINPYPEAIADPAAVTVFQGQPMPELMVQQEGGSIEYQWYDAEMGGTLLGTGSSYIPNDPGSLGDFVFYVEAVNTLSNCTDGSRTAITLSIVPAIGLDVKVLLQGAYDPSTFLMSTELGDNGLVPLTQPFNREPWYYSGDESVANGPDFPATLTDWVLLELRDAADNAIVLEQRAALLLSDGSVVDTDGSSGVIFLNAEMGSSYFISVKTRNHLALLSAVAVTLPNVGTPYDFTSPLNVMGGLDQLAALDLDLYGMLAGDFDSNGIVTIADFNNYNEEASLINVYTDGDCSYDKAVTIADFNLFQDNSSKIGVNQIRY